MTLTLKITELGECVGTMENALFEFDMHYAQILPFM